MADRAEKIFAFIGKTVVAALLVFAVFHLGTQQTRDTAQAVAPAALPAEVMPGNAALTAYLNSPAVNSQGDTVGTVGEVITRYGCEGYYRVYCIEAEGMR